MIFITSILKEKKIMSDNQITIKTDSGASKAGLKLNDGIARWLKTSRNQSSPFWVLVHKEIADQVSSWRFIILISIIALTCLGSLYTSMSNIADALKKLDADDTFLFLKLYTVSDGTLPSFYVFVGFLGPLLGISLGFDAINSEYNRGTISRIMAQPIPRDFLINAKFTASLIVVGIMLFALSFLVMGIGLIGIGLPPTAEEFIRIISYTFLSIVYIAFWLNLSIFFSIRFRQAATSALSGIAIWLFFSVFYGLLVNVIFKVIAPADNLSIKGEKLKLGILRIAPNQLFNDISTSILRPSIRSLGPLSMEQVDGAIPSQIPVLQSILIVWPQITAIIALTVLCFVFSYYLFMKREIR